MDSRSPPIVEYLGKPFDDPDYDKLLQEFASDHPAELQLWRETERQLFERRQGLGAYANQQLMNVCWDFLRPRLIDELGGLGPSKAWKVMRGRILRAVIDERPDLNPAPEKVLITEPRTCSDTEIIWIGEAFRRDHPTIWAEWERIEAERVFEDNPLREVSNAFRHFLYTNCWVQTTTAVATVFLAARGLFFCEVGRRSKALGRPL